MWPLSIILVAIGFIYPFLIYPLLMRFFVRLSPKSEPSQLAADDYPTAAMLICALNEQNIIRQKVENSLRLNYAPGKLKIIFVSDGSTDATVDILNEYLHCGIQVIAQKERRGKLANINEVIPQLTTDIVVLSDANVLYASDALLRLASRFSDPSVGAVSGKVVLTDHTSDLEDSTQRYYSVEWFLQEAESQLYSMVGADGAMYAIRRELFQTCPPDTLIEDFVIPLSIVRHGKRVVLEPSAIGWERAATSLREEFHRRIRIAAGAAQVIFRPKFWPIPAPLIFWFSLLSHKFIRWMTPVFGVALVLLCLFSLHQLASRMLLSAIAVVTGLAVIKLLTKSVHPLFCTPFYLLFGQITLGLGLLKGLTRTQSVLWAKENR